MKKTILSCLVILAMFSIPFTVIAAKEVKVEVLYMNHGPLQSSLEQIKQVFSKYGNKIEASWYDFESKEGEQFMAKKGGNPACSPGHLDRRQVRIPGER